VLLSSISLPALPAGYTITMPTSVTVTTGGTATATVTVHSVQGFPNTYTLTFRGRGGRSTVSATATLITR
jgi:hypothetical protein